VLVRRAAAGHAAGRVAQLKPPRGFGLDGAVVPGLLLLVARDLALHDPPRVLAWRLAHDARLAAAFAWLGPLVPAPSGAWDRDPIALALAALATLLALAYAALAAAGARTGHRALVVGLAAFLLVVLPSAALIAMGVVADRPYGQDGGVVQLPLALDRILAGQSPYAADYSGTILGRQARVSSFWDELGGNPILRHHAYLPGTHLVMLPFHLASKAAFGSFDPRVVTLLFYVASVLLASRLPTGDGRRLAAAAVAAFNPLVYWHQIFGANDVVFVAMLLAAVLLARSERRLAAGALLGLACATKQLAWPFAPFLLAALAGARSFRDWTEAASWKRLAPPLGTAAAVFLLVVAPVALLDSRAFWADVFVYNAGLKGGDNYPIGGTPGFGFANFLIYFGRVHDLRDYFPFSVFFPLLAALGLLLLRAQMRDGRPEWALATGSAALALSLYFSRVVHPNYLVAVAVCLPLAALSARRAADLALAPLLLLALAVEIVENAVFRTTWEQLSAAGLAERATGWAALLLPRAGPSLTHDPLGLVVGASAAGLGVLYLSLAACGAGRRSRAAILGAAVVLVVVAPALLLSWLSTRTGLVRAQDPAVVQTAADAARLADGRSPFTAPAESAPRGREAYSESFRLDPPAELLPHSPTLPPGLSVLAAAAHGLGARDPRVVSLVALLALAGAVALALDGPARLAALAVALLAAPLALGSVLGSPAAVSLAALVAAWALSSAGHAGLAGALAGAAIALDHRALVAVPFAAFGQTRPRATRGALAAAVAYAAIVAPVALLDVSAFLARASAATSAGPGLGLANLLAYRGAEGVAAAFGPLAPLLTLGAMVWLLTQPWSWLARAALATLVSLVLAPAVSANAVAVPIVLLALAAVGERESGTEEQPGRNGPTARINAGGTELQGGFSPP
jgi:glycosyl transferase family 87